MNKSLSPEVKMHVYWGPPNTCRSAQNYLCDNPVVAKPLMLEHVKPAAAGPLGHYTGPALHYVYSSQPQHHGGTE